MKKTEAPITRQKGAALLLLMLVVIIAMSALLLSGLNRNELRLRRIVDTAHSLAIAKDALINYALINTDLNTGRAISLPCPDIDETGGFIEGQAHTTACGPSGVTVIGRLPWRTLGVESLQDSSQACLWYVVSGSYKDAGPATAAMINTDSNGQLQLFGVETGAIVSGARPDERPVAFVMASMQPVNGQTRPPLLSGANCAATASAASYLDTDTVSGIANSSVTGVADSFEAFAATVSASDTHNDRIIAVTREDIASRIHGRADFDADMRALGLAAAACLADYAANNPGGVDDKRLPWPAPVSLADYRPDLAYDDADIGFLSGRLPDVVDDSNTSTGNGIAQVLSACNTVAVPGWTPARQSAWQNWKDHFFYAVANSFSPSAATPSSCSSCLTVNGSGQYAALLIFSNGRLNSSGQLRNAPPMDTDTKGDSGNYLESTNASNVPGTGTATDYLSQVATATFNDLLFCIDDQLVVTEC